MAGLHEVDCASNRRNTGFGGCPVDWKLIVGMFLFDSPVSFSEAELADLQNTLQTRAFQDSKTGRCFPIHNFLNPVDATDKSTIETFTDGSKAKVRDGVFDWSWQITAGAFCLYQAMRTHIGNSSTYALFYDKERKILGYNNNGELAAIPLMIFDVPLWNMNTGSNTAKYMLNAVFDATYGSDNADYTKASFPLTNVLGLQDVKLRLNSWNHATGVTNVTVMTECGGSNLYDSYSTELLAALWVAQNTATGATIPITSVTPIAGSKTFNVALNTGNANYPTNNAITLSLAAPSVLSAAGIVGYESEPATLTVISS